MENINEKKVRYEVPVRMHRAILHFLNRIDMDSAKHIIASSYDGKTPSDKEVDDIYWDVLNFLTNVVRVKDMELKCDWAMQHPEEVLRDFVE